MAEFVAKPSNKLTIKTQRVITAFLAKKEIEGIEKTGEMYSYKFKGSNNTSSPKRKKKIAKIIYKNIKKGLGKKQTTNVEEVVSTLTKKSYQKGDCIDIPLVKEKIKFNEIKDAQLGEEVYVVVKTENMPGREINMNLKQGGATKVLTEKEDAIRVIQKGRNAYMFTATVGAFTKKNTFSNAKDFENYGIAKITSGSTDKDTNTQYKEALEKVEGQRTQLYLAMDAEPANQNWLEVKYEEVFDNRPNLWYYGKGNWFELKSIAKWHHPVKSPQLRGNYAIWAPERGIHSKNSKGRAKGKHRGRKIWD